MKFKLSLVLIICVFCVFLGNSCSEGGIDQTSPEKLIKTLSNLISIEDKVNTENCFTGECWKSRNDSGERFVKQAVRKKFELKLIDSKLKEAKAVVTADIIIKGKIVDRLYFYAINNKGIWKIDGLNENKNQGEHYINDRLPARFNISSYKGNQELEDLGTKLLSLAKQLKVIAKDDQEQKKTLLNDLFIGNAAENYSKLRLLLKVSDLSLKIVSTHMVTSIKRGAIVVKDESGKEKVFIYLERDKEGWKLINCLVGWLSAESLLR